jgi:hypothetical protein
MKLMACVFLLFDHERGGFQGRIDSNFATCSSWRARWRKLRCDGPRAAAHISERISRHFPEGNVNQLVHLHGNEVKITNSRPIASEVAH